MGVKRRKTKGRVGELQEYETPFIHSHLQTTLRSFRFSNENNVIPSATSLGWDDRSSCVRST